MSARSLSIVDPPLDLEVAKELLSGPVVPEVVASLTVEAGRELRALADRARLEMSEGAYAGLLDHFRQILSRLTNLVLVQRYASFHLVANPLWRPRAAPPGPPAEPGPRDVLDAYIQWEEIEKVLAPDGPYPALSELLRKGRSNWLNASREVLERATRHRTAIAAVAGIAGDALGPLTGLSFGISDPHNDGRTVAILHYGPRRVVYKPRSLVAEAAWNEIFGRASEAVLDAPALKPRVVSFDDYGFMEFVETADCAGEEAVRRCYVRYGVLIAVAHALGAIDLHHENVIVSGEHPVAVDCEPLFRARLATSRMGDSRLKIERNLSLSDFDVRESVLELSVLPTVMEVPYAIEGIDQTPLFQDIEIGALCAYAAKAYRETVPCAMGTDQMHMRPYPVTARAFPNLPRLDGEPMLPRHYVESIVEGFEAAHRYLSADKKIFIGEGGLLDTLARCRVRLLARPTMDYMNVLARSLSPQALRSTEARRDMIRRDLASVAVQRMDAIADLAEHEAKSLLDGDIPFFSLDAGDDVCAGARLHASPLQAAKTRWNAMDDFDRTMQVAQIREQLLRRDQAVSQAKPDLSDAAAIETHAFAIAESLAHAAIEQGGAPCWVFATYAPGVASTMAHSDREALYEGSAGTALMLAEAGALAGRDDWISLAVRVFDPILKRGEQPQCVTRGGGLGRGLGGLIYALVRIARVSGREDLLEAANRLALDYGPWLAERETTHELLYGRAGFLLSLLALHRSRPDPGLKALADTTARLIIDGARAEGDAIHWPTANGREMPNPSHGSSGIAMALARWARLSGDERAGALAVGALRHDDRFWVEQESGWADGRFQDVALSERTNWSWCNGRSGALLARLAVSEALGTRFLCEPVERAIDAKTSDVIADVSPGLCCGTAGAIDALHVVCHRHRQERLAAQTQRAAERLAKSSPQNHYLTLTGSLFTGSAGLAFGLLRAARPDRIESVLWFA